MRYLGGSSRNSLRQVQERWRLLNFLHCNLEAAPRESREAAAAAAEARTNGHTAHGTSHPALKSHKSRKKVGGKDRLITHLASG